MRTATWRFHYFSSITRFHFLGGNDLCIFFHVLRRRWFAFSEFMARDRGDIYFARKTFLEVDREIRALGYE